jgi:hypothetical protein
MLMDDRTYHLVRSFLKKEKNEGLTRFGTMSTQLIGTNRTRREGQGAHYESAHSVYNSRDI